MGSDNTDEKDISCESLSKFRTSMYLFFGIILPVTSLTVNYKMFGGKDFDMFYLIGASFFLPRLAYLYVIVGSGIAALFLWMFVFRFKGKQYNGFIGGILLFNALFHIAFVIAAINRMGLFIIWLPPFCAAPVFLLSGIGAIKIAASVLKKRTAVLTAIGGFLFVVALSLSTVRQPWGLIKHLPNAQGANLSGMDMSHIYLDGGTGVTFKGANLSNANLSRACLVNCNINMQKANLEGANLSHAVLSIVNLKGANLRGANLDNAKIYQVDFTGADLQEASLGFHARGRVSMNNANLCGCDLRKIKDIEGVYFWEGAIYDSKTLWLEDFDPDEKGAVFKEEIK